MAIAVGSMNTLFFSKFFLFLCRLKDEVIFCNRYYNNLVSFIYIRQSIVRFSDQWAGRRWNKFVRACEELTILGRLSVLIIFLNNRGVYSWLMPGFTFFFVIFASEVKTLVTTWRIYLYFFSLKFSHNSKWQKRSS